MDNAIYQLRQYESEIQMNNMMNRMSINKAYKYIESRWHYNDAILIKDAYDTIVNEGLLDWFKNFTPAEEKGYMFSNNPELGKISSNLKLKEQHSGASFGMTLRAVKNVIENV
jgi:hypothetical protein